MPRIHCPVALQPHTLQDLPDAATRHVQVLRMQPGQTLTLFDGQGGEYDATVEAMGRNRVTVQLGAHHAVEREAARAVHLAVGVPAGDRMDWLIEKATELGAAAFWPLFTERSVLRLKGERADKKREHWQAVAVAACEQCGRNRVPVVQAPQELPAWLAGAQALPGGAVLRLRLSLQAGAQPLREAAATTAAPVCLLSGPEGGLSPAEEASAQAQGWLAVTLGPRVLRADTAPLAALATLVVD